MTTKWYNRRHEREGCLWAGRFKGVVVHNGEAQLTCSAYIDLNPVRAGLVQRPEDYRWCSLGLRVRQPKRARKLLTLLPVSAEGYWSDPPMVKQFKKWQRVIPLDWYREFVYKSGGISGINREGKAGISREIIDSVVAYHKKLGIGDRLGYRIRNISEGIAIGSYDFIRNIQGRLGRKFLRPRSFLSGDFLYSTRVLRE